MNQHTPAIVAGQEAPPPPYRGAAWYDPRIVHQPCQCPRCRPKPKVKRPALRLALVICGGVLLPLISIACNFAFKVVAVGPLLLTWGLLSVVSVIAHLALTSGRIDPETKKLVLRVPHRTSWRVVLFLGSASGCLLWGYFALLFLPLLPLSVVAIVFVGLGFCGVCPFLTVPIHIVHLVRDYRALKERLSTRWAFGLLLALLLLPLVAAIAAAEVQQQKIQTVDRIVDDIGAAPQDSASRMAHILRLEGKENTLAELYLRTEDYARRQSIARTYHRLADVTIHDAVHRERWQYHKAMIRPWWFVQGISPISEGYMRW